MSIHHFCKTNCGGTDCDAPKRIEAARQEQPIAELERKMKKATRRGYYTQEGLDWAKAWGRAMVAKLRASSEP